MNWRWRIRHARGYRELGLLREAREELDCVPEAQRNETAYLAEVGSVSLEQGEWDRLRTTCCVLARRHPDEPSWWIMWAFGARRADSLTTAEKVLLEAETYHPAEPTIQFNLGCYACQLGNFDGARRRIQTAITLDEKFAGIAAMDADLEPLRKTLPIS